MFDNNRQFSHKEGCPECGSRDNVAVYTDGYKKCFTPKCEYYDYEGGIGRPSLTPVKSKTSQMLDIVDKVLQEGDVVRGLSARTCKDFNYAGTVFNGMDARISTYVDQSGKPTSQKVRLPNKEFFQLGQPAKAMPYGYHLWEEHHKELILCEGEEDAMSIYQAIGGNKAVGSVPNGAGKQTPYYIKNILEHLDRFTTIYLGFDNDEAGHDVIDLLKPLLEDKDLRIITWKRKDANDSLKLNKVDEIIDAINTAKVVTIEGIVSLCDIDTDLILESCQPGIPLDKFPRLASKLKWLKKGAIYTLAAKPGCGKSTMTRELANDLIKRGYNVGALYLEDSIEEVAKDFVSMHLGIPKWRFESNLDAIGGAEGFQKALDAYKGMGLHLYEHKGRIDAPTILKTLKLMRKKLNCDVVIFDNVSLVLAAGGQGLQEVNQVIADIVRICQETGVCIINVCHLKKNTQKTETGEDSEVISASDVYGTGDINKFSTALIAMEKIPGKSATVLKILKNRTTGQEGYCDVLKYDVETGGLTIHSNEHAFEQIKEEGLNLNDSQF